jgi:integrase
VSDALLSPKDRLRALAEQARDLTKENLAEGTRYTYASRFGKFKAWCEELGVPSCPTTPEVVVCYLTALSRGEVTARWTTRWGKPQERTKVHKASDIAATYVAILHYQRAAGVDWPQAHPGITKVLKGIRRRLGTKRKQAAPLEVGDFKKCLSVMSEARVDDLVVVRNRAILAVGFWGALRSQEIVDLKISDLEFAPQGIMLHLRKTKEDQEATGQEVPLMHQADKSCCPVALLTEYLTRVKPLMPIASQEHGPLFRRIDPRSDCVGDRHMWKDVVGDLVKEVCERAGLDPARFSAHSLRAGFITSAAGKGVTLDNIMRQSRHKDPRVAATYIRHKTVWDHNAAEGLADEPEEK